jgi:hypothetical protein
MNLKVVIFSVVLTVTCFSVCFAANCPLSVENSETAMRGILANDPPPSPPGDPNPPPPPPPPDPFKFA